MQLFLQLTMTSLLSIILFSLILALFLVITLQNNKLLSNVKHELLLLCMLVPIVRLIIPVEIIPWTQNINITLGFPEVIRFFNRCLFQYNGQKFCLWDIIITFILCSAIINTIKTIVEYVLFIKSKNTNPTVDELIVHSIIEQILSETGKKIPVTVRRTDEDTSPFVYGITTPTILLPQKEYNDIQLECILRHEMAHYLHGDLIMRFLWSLIKSFCYWNPAVYILDNQLEKILEIRADENVLKNQKSGFFKSYLSVIVELSTHPTAAFSKFQSCFYKPSGLTARKRIEIVLFRSKRKYADFLVTNISIVLPIILIIFAMNFIIFEPKGTAPDIDSSVVYQTTKDATIENSFFVRNTNGTYDMYLDGVYITTLESTYGSNITIYETLKEAVENEETY